MAAGHYVSRFHLREFCDTDSLGTPDPWLWIGTIADNSVKRRAPKNVGTAPDLFDGPGGFAEPDATVEQRSLYTELLRSSADVSTASRGEHALSLASAEPPDVVILDVMMPGMDGWETCRRLKADPATKDIPIIMLTSLDGVDVPARARQAGAIAVLMKPCPAERLILTINAAARHSSVDADLDMA